MYILYKQEDEARILKQCAKFHIKWIPIEKH